MISTLLERRGRETAHPSTAPAWLVDALGGGGASASGIKVTPDSALQYTAYWAAVNIIAGSIGALPLLVYERLERGKERATKHPAWRLLYDRPNEYMDALTFRETIQGHVLTWGNGYAEIQRGGDGRPIALWPLLPNRTRAKLDAKRRLYYEVDKPDGGQANLAPENVLHLKGLGFDGLVGYSPVRYHSEAIGLAQATQGYAAGFFKRGATPSGVMEHPGQLSELAKKNLRDSTEREHAGLDQAHRIWILEEDMKWHQIGVPANEAQLLESRKFSVADIARIFQVPMHMLAEMDRATFANIEHQGIEFLTQTLFRWMRRWEMEAGEKLFGIAERETHFAEFLVEAFLRGDTLSRYRAYHIGRQGGWLSANDVRERENMNPVEGGDEYLAPLNMAPVGGEGKTDDDALLASRLLAAGGLRLLGAGSGEAKARATARALEGVVAETAGRMLRKELNDARRALGRHGGDGFEAWIEKHYQGYEAVLRSALAPGLEAAAGAVWSAVGEGPVPAEALERVAEWIRAAVERHREASVRWLRAHRNEAPENLAWPADRAKRFAQEEMERLLVLMGNAE